MARQTQPLLTLACLVAATVFSASPAVADRCQYEGQSHRVLDPSAYNIGFTLCEDHFAKGTGALSDMEAVIAKLNDVQGSKLHFRVKGFVPHREYHDLLKRDGTFSFDFVKAEPTRSGDASFAGRTITRATGGKIAEFDIALNKHVRWRHGDATEWDLKAKGGYLQTILLHEIGHGLGFPHNQKATSELTIMGAKTGKWVGDRKAGLKPHDHGHIRFHYGDGNVGKPDLVLSNYHTEENKQSGQHKCKLNEAMSTDSTHAGASIQVGWTLFNTGSAPASAGFKTTIVLSKTNGPATNAHVLGTFTQESAVAASSSSYQSLTVQLPKDIAPGTYIVGLIVDACNVVAEHHEDNNALPLPQRLTIEAARGTLFSNPQPTPSE